MTFRAEGRDGVFGRGFRFEIIRDGRAITGGLCGESSIENIMKVWPSLVSEGE